MRTFLDRHDRILVEAAVVERLRRSEGIALHPRLANALLVRERAGRRVLRAILDEYLDVAARARLPMIVFAPTWRASRERVVEANAAQTINRDAVAFVREVLAARPDGQPPVRVGGLLGCRGDAYRPEEALGVDEAARFHAWQADELASAGCDFLAAVTMPALSEARGAARALASTGTEFVVSLVLSSGGSMLDGTPLDDAVRALDDDRSGAALGYAVNCVHPSFVSTAGMAEDVRRRLVLVQANAAAVDPRSLDGAGTLRADPVDAWAAEMVRIGRETGVRALGGCCGTDARHLEAIVERWRDDPGSPD